MDFTDLSLAVNQASALGSDPIGRGVLSSYGHRAGYAGYQWTPAAGLYHVRHRWYDPLNGTWISKDPAGYVDGASLFQYAGGMPLVGLDPYGLSYWQDFREGGKHLYETLFGDPNQDEIDWANMMSRTRMEQVRRLLDAGLRCRALRLLGNGMADMDGVFGAHQDAADQTVELLKDVLKTAIPSVPFVKIGPITKVLKHIRTGREYKITKNLRIAPWGNRVYPNWAPGSKAFQRPHYHRRIVGPDGKTIPGGGPGYHRPWEWMPGGSRF